MRVSSGFVLKMVVHLNRQETNETNDRTAWLQLATPSDHEVDEAGDACVSKLCMKDTVMTHTHTHTHTHRHTQGSPAHSTGLSVGLATVRSWVRSP